MLKSNSKSPGNRVVSPEEEKEKLQWEGFAEKEGLKSVMKERVGDDGGQTSGYVDMTTHRSRLVCLHV